MTTRTTKFALLGTASVAAAAFALPTAASAQATTCTVSATDSTVFNCFNGTTQVSTVTVPSGTLTGTPPLTVVSNSGNISVTAVPVNNGTIQNPLDAALFLNNSFAGGTTTLNAGAQNFSGYVGVAAQTQGATTLTVGNVTGEAAGVEVVSTGPITITAGNVVATDGDAIYAEGGTGAISITSNSVTATNGGGVEARSTSGAITIRSGAVQVTNAPVGGIVATSTTGAIDIGNCPTVATTGPNSPGINANTTTGSITINCGTITTNGANSDGVIATSGTGAIAVTTGTVNTGNNLDSDGVVLSTTGAITANTGVITTGGADSSGLLINGGAGAINATVAGATTTGANSDAVSITGAGPVTVTNSGTINVSGANSVGIDIATTGTGAVNVTTGTVTSTAANAAADPTFAAVRVLASGVAPVNIVANGNVTTTNGSAIWAQTAGAATVTVNSGATVTGPVAVTLGGTTGNTLIVNGTIGSTIAGNPAYVVAGSGPFTLTVGATGTVNGPLTFTAGNDTFNNNRTAGMMQVGALNFGAGNDAFNNTTSFTQTAAIGFGEGNDTLTNSGQLNLNGVVDFGLGTDLFTNTATGTVTLTGATSLLGLETLTNNGTFNQNFGLTFDAGATAVTNAGTMNVMGTTDFGAGTDTFTNTGVLNVRNGATTFAGLETFTNAGGIIDLRDGAANDTFTVSGNYVATGNARLGIDVVGANNVLTADRLVIGGTTTGTTNVLAQFTGQSVIDPVGALIVDSTLNNIAAGQFVLGGVTNAGFINYSLETRAGDVFLVARPDEAVFDQLFVGRIANDIWYQSAEAYQAYAASRRIDFGNERKGPVGIWAQLYGGKQRSGDRDRQFTAFNTTLTSSNRFEHTERGAQVGLDFGVQNFIVGVTAGYERAEGDSDLGTEIVAEGYNYGAYAQFGAQQGLYAGLLLKRDDYDLRLTNALAVGGARPDGRSTGIDGEVGFRFGNPGSINFDLGAGLSYVRSKVDNYNFGFIGFENERYTSTRGRLQARASFAGILAPFIDAKVFREFGDDNELTLTSGALNSTVVDGKRGTWARVEGGIGGGAGGGPLLSGWVDLGDVKGWGVRGGFRF